MISNHGIQSIAIQMGYLATPRHQIRFCHSTNCSNLLNGPQINCISPIVPRSSFRRSVEEHAISLLKSIQEVAFYTFIDENARNVCKSSRKKEAVDSKSQWSPRPRTELCDARSLQPWSGPCLSWIRRDSCGNFKWHHASPKWLSFKCRIGETKRHFFESLVMPKIQLAMLKEHLDPTPHS